MFECVTFKLADQRYAIDIMKIREVREVQSISQVPGTGKGFAGIIEIRNKIVPVFDLRGLFDQPALEREGECAVIIVKFGGERVGYLVDEITDIERINEKDVMNADSYTNLANAAFVQSVFSIEDKVTMVIDMDKVLAVHGSYRDDLAPEEATEDESTQETTASAA